MSSTTNILMKRALREMDVGMLFPNTTISALAAGSFTAPSFFLDTAMSQSFLQDRSAGIVRTGTVTANNGDFWRPAGAIVPASGLVNQVGAVWADSTLGSEDIEVWFWRVRRDLEVLDVLNRVMEFEPVTTMLAVSHLGGLDGDMALSTDTNWTDVLTPTTSAKTALNTATQIVPWGPRAYQVVSNAANEGTRSAAVTMRKEGQVKLFAIATADSGTASLQPYDATNSATFGTAVTHSERRPQLMACQQETLPDTCSAVQAQMLGTVNPSDIYWNQVWLYNLDNLACRLPALVVDSFQAPKFVWAIPRKNTASNVWDTESFEFEPLTENIDYRLVINHADAEPYKVQFLRESPYRYPIYVEARVSIAALGAASAEADVIQGPLHKLMPRFKRELLKTVYNTGSRRHPDWDRQWQLANEEMSDAAKARPILTAARAKPWFSGITRL